MDMQITHMTETVVRLSTNRQKQEIVKEKEIGAEGGKQPFWEQWVSFQGQSN